MGAIASKCKNKNKDVAEDEFYSKSSEVIDKIVERYLADQFINNPMIPDYVERRIYRNVAKIVIGLLKDSLENTNIQLLGHKIAFSMEPITE